MINVGQSMLAYRIMGNIFFFIKNTYFHTPLWSRKEFVRSGNDSVERKKGVNVNAKVSYNSTLSHTHHFFLLFSMKFTVKMLLCCFQVTNTAISILKLHYHSIWFSKIIQSLNWSTMLQAIYYLQQDSIKFNQLLPSSDIVFSLSKICLNVGLSLGSSCQHCSIIFLKLGGQELGIINLWEENH